MVQAGWRRRPTRTAMTAFRAGAARDRELCSSSPWLTGILDPNALDKLAGFDNYLSVVTPTVKQQFFHPNITGYAHMTQLLAVALQVP